MRQLSWSGGGITFEQAKALAAKSQAETNNSTDIFVRQFGVDRAEMSKEFLSGLRYDFIKPNNQFIECFRRSNATHGAITHNSFSRAKEIIKRCGLSSYIPDERIISVTDKTLPLKHEGSEAFEHLLTLTGTRPEDAVMIEDTPINLSYPKAMGMQTVLIERAQPGDKSHAQHIFEQPIDFMKAYLRQVAPSRHAR